MVILKKCFYKCGQEAKYQFKNGNVCCSDNPSKCPTIIEKVRKSKIGKKNPMFGKHHSVEFKKKLSKQIKLLRKDKRSNYNTKEFKEKQFKSQIEVRNTKEWKSNCREWMKKAWKDERIGNIEWKEKQRISQKLSINKIKNRYPLFFKIEEIRYNPDNPGEKEIQVHCKNHSCLNSKEMSGWFTPTYIQLYERIRQIERNDGQGGCYFYCSKECKNVCPLYGLRDDPFKEIEKQYTSTEYQTFRLIVLERDNYTCQYCGKPATDVHHERPQKLEPFFALDPDYAWSCCEKCHYSKGHIGECSTLSLAVKGC